MSPFESVVRFPGMVGLNDSRVAANTGLETGYIIRLFSARWIMRVLFLRASRPLQVPSLQYLLLWHENDFPSQNFPKLQAGNSIMTGPYC